MKMNKQAFLMRTHIKQVDNKKNLNPIELMIQAVRENSIPEVNVFEKYAIPSTLITSLKSCLWSTRTHSLTAEISKEILSYRLRLWEETFS